MAAPRRPRKKRAALDAAAVPREPLSAEELRRRAEEHLAGLDEAAAAAPEELAAAVHELRVHQIELEMQNEELRHAQLELDARRAKYLELFDLAPVGYLTLSDQGIVGDANLTAARLLGVERQLLVGQPFSAFVLPPDRDAYYVHFLKLVKTEAPQTCELRLQRLGDEPFWARLESQPQGGADGDEPFRYHLTFTDVHERVTAEESLRRSERALQSTVDGLAATIALLDERGTIVLVNQPWRDFAEHNGLTADAVFVGTNYLRVCDQATGAYSEGAAQFAAGIRAVLSAETDAYSMEYPCDAPDKKRWSAGRVTAFPGEGPRHVVVAHVDITERKQAVEALREREAVFRSVVEQAGDAIGLVDVATGRFVELNDAACRNLGYSHDELMSLSLADIDLQWPGEGIVPALAELQATGGNEFETRHRRKDGEIRDVRVTASLIDVAGRALFSAIWSDITERKRAEEELAGHRQRLEELVAERTEELGEANRILATGVAEVARWRQNFDTFFNTIDDLLFVLDADGTMIHVNETVCRRLGYSEAELLGRPVLDVHPPLRREEAGRIVAAMLSGEADFCPVPVVTKGGAEIPVETRVVPGVWDGEPALFGVTKDVSALKLSEEKFQRLFHGNPALMAVTSLPERIYTDVNEAFLSALGYSREEVLGRTATELGLFIEPEQQRELAEQMQARGRVADRELKVRRKDGTILEGLFSGEIIESRGQQYFLTVMIDQTERKLAEEELRQSEEQLARAVEGSGVGLWDWRPQTGAETFNERWAEIAGYTLAELTPTSIETWRGLTHPDDLKRADELLEEHFSGRSAIYACEARVRHKDGRWVWVLDQGKVSEWDSDGRPLRMTGTALDVSEGKRAEEALRQATDRLSLAARAGGVGVWDYDTVNDTLTWDDQMFALYGITREQFGGAYEAWQAGLHPGDKERGDAEIQMALRGERDFDTEFRVLWPDGTIRDIRALALVQRDARGRPTRMIGTNWDISERKRLEAELTSSERNFRAFFDAIDDMIVVGAPDGRVVYANPAVSAKLGYSAAEVTALHVLDLNPADRRPEAEAIFAAMLRGERESCPLPLQSKSGALVPAETRVWFGQWDGADCIFGVCKDLTKEQEALQKFEQLFRGNPSLMALSSLPERRFTDVNEAFLSTLGYSREEVLGHTSEELRLAVEPEQQLAIAEQLQAQGRVAGRELKIRCKDGAILDGLFSGEVIESQGQQYFLTVMSDQTERKRAEEALRGSEERFRTMFAGSRDAMMTVAAPSWRFTAGNPAALEMFGVRDAAEFTALGPWDVSPERQPDGSPSAAKALEALEAAVREGSHFFEWTHKPLGGADFPCTVLLTRIDMAGQAFVQATVRDISAQKHAEDSLRDSEELLARAVEGSGVGLWDWNPQTGAEAMSERWAEMIGCTLAELSPLSSGTWRGLAHADDLRRSDELFEQHFAGLSAMYECEVRLRHKDGHWVWVLGRGKVVEWDADGRPVRMIGTDLDVTERKHVEEALRESEEKHRLLIENSHDIIYTLSADGVFTFVSPAWTALLGHPLDQVAGQPFQQFVHPADLPGCMVFLQSVIETGQRQEGVEYRVRHLDGSWRWHTSSAVPLRDEGGAVIGFEGTARDITDRRQAEEALREAADRLSLAARAGGVGLWDYDPINDTLTWDDQMFALYGITREQFSGAYEAWQAGLHSDDRQRGDAEIQAALRGELEFDTEFRVLWPDGAVRTIRALALVQRDARGRPTRMIGTNWDITAEKRAEEQIQQRSQALAHLNDELVSEAAALAEANATITRIAATDHLTGLANRRHFYEALEKAISLARRHGYPLALVSLDLDGLKRVNDSAGHEAGDEVLTSFAGLLRDLCRVEDLPGRDEFSLLLPGDHLGGALGLAERLLAAVHTCEALAERGVTVSGGVAQWAPGEFPDDLLRRADQALYTAKRDGGDAVAGDA